MVNDVILLETLAAAFVTDPLYRWLFPDPATRSEAVRANFELMLALAHDRGIVDTDPTGIAVRSGPSPTSNCWTTQHPSSSCSTAGHPLAATQHSPGWPGVPTSPAPKMTPSTYWRSTPIISHGVSLSGCFRRNFASSTMTAAAPTSSPAANAT